MKGNKLWKLVVPISLILALVLVVPMLSGCFPKAAEPAAPAAPAPEPAAPAEPEPTLPPEEVKPIIIGAPLPLTGFAGADAIEEERGMIMAVDHINARGGLLGRPVEFVITDVVDWQAEYQIAARDYLMSLGVEAFFPGWGQDPAFMDVFGAENTGGIPYIHVSTVELFAEMRAENLDKYWNTLMWDDTARIYGPNAYAVFMKSIPEVYDYPNQTVAILTSEITYNMEISDGLRALIETDPEWEVVVDELHPFGSLEFGVQLAKIRETEPGFIFFSTVVVPEAVAFTNQFLANPTNSLIHIQYAPSSPEYRRIMGDKSIGIQWQTIIGPNPTHEALVWRVEYLEKFGEPAGLCLAWSNYDMIMAWAEAVEAVGDVKDYRGIIDYLATTPIKGFTFGPGGTNISESLGADRTNLRPYLEVWPGTGGGYDVGSSIHYYQIQDTSAGPQDILTHMHGVPADEYMMEYYGYPAVGKYTDEVGANFQVPPWIE